MSAPVEPRTRAPLNRYVPGAAAAGAATLYVNVPIAPGATVVCTAVAYRVAESQPLLNAASDWSCALQVTLSSRHAARSTCVAVPLTQLAVPVLAKKTVNVPDCPGASVRNALSPA